MGLLCFRLYLGYLFGLGQVQISLIWFKLGLDWFDWFGLDQVWIGLVWFKLGLDWFDWFGLDQFGMVWFGLFQIRWNAVKDC